MEEQGVYYARQILTKKEHDALSGKKIRAISLPFSKKTPLFSQG
jgi:hypothetical protein